MHKLGASHFLILDKMHTPVSSNFHIKIASPTFISQRLGCAAIKSITAMASSRLREPSLLERNVIIIKELEQQDHLLKGAWNL